MRQKQRPNRARCERCHGIYDYNDMVYAMICGTDDKMSEQLVCIDCGKRLLEENYTERSNTRKE